MYFMMFKRDDGEEPNFFNISEDDVMSKNLSHHIIPHEEAKGLMRIPHEVETPENLNGHGSKMFRAIRFTPSEKEKALLILKYLEK